jgi:5-methylcytosine-specific restriction endonuclease McrA
MSNKHKNLKQADRQWLAKLKEDIEFPVQCAYCDAWLVSSTHTFDHMVPLSKGGAPHGQNLANCCFPCNQAKGDMSAGEYRALMAAAVFMAAFVKEGAAQS